MSTAGQADSAPGPESIAEAVRRLRAGRLVAFPTETVYGLGADATSEPAVRRVFEAKGRPPSNPLIVHVSGQAMAGAVVEEWTEDAAALADAFWPGPLSIVLRKSASIPGIVTAGGPTVAVRAPRHPLTLALLDAFAGALVGPSANRSGRLSPTAAAHVAGVWNEEEVFVLDGGPCEGGIESTVVSLAGERARVLRPGAIGAVAIGEVLGQECLAHDSIDDHGPGAVKSPGLLGPHYQPSAPVELRDVPEPAPGEVVVELPDDPREAAARFYALLREADASNPARILVRRPPDTGTTPPETALWDAINDRLRRASAST